MTKTHYRPQTINYRLQTTDYRLQTTDYRLSPDLSIKFCGIKFKNPTVLASGVLGVTASSWRNVARNGAAGITTKSIWLHEHKGHPNPVIIANKYYMLNAVGLSDAGAEKARDEIKKYLGWYKSKDVREKVSAPLIASIVAGCAGDFGKTAEAIAALRPHLLEINISCPNIENEFGKPFACISGDAAHVTKEIKKALKRAHIKIPVIVKLSPNVLNIVEIARAVVNAGADGLNIGNTFGPGMAIDIETRKPVLSNRVGGLSGPALKPIAVKMIYDVHRALPAVPIIGTGGILTGRDAIEIMMAGATLVGIGTAMYYRGADVFKKITREMQEWCRRNKVKKLSSIIGTVHR